jgi:alcohol dehydrogenase class IV
MLPHTIAALQRRGASASGAALGLARDLARRAGATHLGELGVSEQTLDECADAAAQRPDLDLIPPRPDRDEIRALYDAAR